MAPEQDAPKPTCRVTDVKPTVENVVPFARYRRTQPEINGVPVLGVPSSDQVLLLAGGRDLILSLLQDEHHRTVEHVEMFVLNIGLLLWFEELDKGIEVPYESIIYHGSIKSAETVGHRLALLITLETDFVLADFFALPQSPGTNLLGECGLNEYTLSTVEITLRPKYSLYDRHFNREIESLFTFDDFGVNRGDEMVDNCNQQLAACLESYCSVSDDADDAVEDDACATVAPYEPFSDALNMLDNTGLADDLGGTAGAVPPLGTHHP